MQRRSSGGKWARARRIYIRARHDTRERRVVLVRFQRVGRTKSTATPPARTPVPVAYSRFGVEKTDPTSDCPMAISPWSTTVHVGCDLILDHRAVFTIADCIVSAVPGKLRRMTI